MKGCIQRRGKMSFRLKFEAAERDPVTGKRKTKYQTFRGTRKEAQVKLAELVAAVGRGTYVEPTKLDRCRVYRRPNQAVGGRP